MTGEQHADRQVHAKCPTFEVVRYNRAGKWYVESSAKGSRELVMIQEAARRAQAAVILGGEINYGLPGGRTFDRLAAS